MSGMTFDKRITHLTNRAIVLAMLPAAGVYIVFDYIGDGGRAVAGGAALYVLIGAFQLFRDLRERTWFWCSMLVIAAVQAALVLAVPWSNGPYPVPLLAILFPLMMVDFFAIYWVIRLEETMMAGGA
ncbi:MAG TPA: hypothetical protein VGF97_04485 [Rhizomicrobium sp.]|jgi:hypothetical protein